MAFSDKWRLADLFTIDQAAALWCNLDPVAFDLLHPIEKHSEAAAIMQLIIGARRAERSGPNSWMAGPAFEALPGRAEVRREWLMELAKSKGERPAFLFDTLLPGRETDQETDTSPVSVPESKKSGGRPPEYDWDGCTIEIIRIANGIDGLPDSQAELVRCLMGWFQSTHGKEPAESSVKARVSNIYTVLGLGRKPPGG